MLVGIQQSNYTLHVWPTTLPLLGNFFFGSLLRFTAICCNLLQTIQLRQSYMVLCGLRRFAVTRAKPIFFTIVYSNLRKAYIFCGNPREAYTQPLHFAHFAYFVRFIRFTRFVHFIHFIRFIRFIRFVRFIHFIYFIYFARFLQITIIYF